MGAGECRAQGERAFARQVVCWGAGGCAGDSKRRRDAGLGGRAWCCGCAGLVVGASVVGRGWCDAGGWTWGARCGRGECGMGACAGGRLVGRFGARVACWRARRGGCVYWVGCGSMRAQGLEGAGVVLHGRSWRRVPFQRMLNPPDHAKTAGLTGKKLVIDQPVAVRFTRRARVGSHPFACRGKARRVGRAAARAAEAGQVTTSRALGWGAAPSGVGCAGPGVLAMRWIAGAFFGAADEILPEPRSAEARVGCSSGAMCGSACPVRIGGVAGRCA